MSSMENTAPENLLTLAERLRWARERKEWSQAHLAMVAEVSTSTVGMIESGARKNKGSLPALAEALGVRYKWLWIGELPVAGPKQEPVAQNAAPSKGAEATTQKAELTAAKPATAPVDEELERRMAGFMALLGHIPKDQRKAALAAATQVLLDHLPLPTTGG